MHDLDGMLENFARRLDQLVSGEDQSARLLAVAYDDGVSLAIVLSPTGATIRQQDRVKVLATSFSHGLRDAPTSAQQLVLKPSWFTRGPDGLFGV